MSAKSTTLSSRTPRDFFAGLFETVLEEIERNPDFAQRLALRMPDGVTLAVAPQRRKKTEPPAELLALDLKEARAELGQIELRDRLARYTNVQLASYIRHERLSSGAISGKNKTQLINIILRASK